LAGIAAFYALLRACVIRRSKTDQEAKGREVCVNAGNRLWHESPAGMARGRLHHLGRAFRSIPKGGRLVDRLTGEGLNLIVKRFCREAHVEGNMGGRSLRSGFVTSAKIGGATDYQICPIVL
jgi:hypothetical protein